MSSYLAQRELASQRSLKKRYNQQVWNKILNIKLYRLNFKNMGAPSA
jgi:hypothetical protein